MTIETPEPYGWMIEGTPLIWRGKYAIADAESYGRNWKDVPEPIPLYREPPAHHFANAGKVMPIGTARELLSIAALEILGLKPSTKLCVMPEAPETPVTEESSAAQPMQDDDLTAVYLAGMRRGKELAKREWVGLTDEDIYEADNLASIRNTKHMNSIRAQSLSPADEILWNFAKAIEAKLKEKNQ